MIGRRTLVPWLTPAKDNSHSVPQSQPAAKQPPVQTVKTLPEPKKVQQQPFQPLRCHLCGSSSPAVRCEQCSNLIFCLSCDDMYHRHPKRRDHVRKLAQRPVTTSPPPPRPPPKNFNLNSPPVPPPRRKKSQVSAPNSPELPRKHEQKIPELPKKQFPLKFGSLKKLLPGRSQAVSLSPQTQSQPIAEPFQQCRINTIDRRDSQKVLLPIRQNYHQYNEWSSSQNQPADQSSSDFDDDDDRRSTGTGTSSGGGIGRQSYPMDGQWPNSARISATLDRRHHQASTLLRHNNSFAAPGSTGPFIKRENPFFLHPQQPPPGHMNHSASVMDLSYQQNIGYPIPQVQSMSDGLEFAGTMAPCGCRPNWIGPDQFGAWLPPARCPMHSSTAALYPQPHMVPPPPPPPWGYPHPYMTSASPPPPPPPPPLAQPQLQISPRPQAQSPLIPMSNSNRKSEQISPISPKMNVPSQNSRNQLLSSSSEDENEKRGEFYSDSDEGDDVEGERKWQEELLKFSASNVATLKQNKEKPVEKVADKDAQWECEHCTFVNEPNVKICAVCCKTRGITSTSPTNEIQNLTLTRHANEPNDATKTLEAKNEAKPTQPEVEVKNEGVKSPKSKSVSTSGNIILQKTTATTAIDEVSSEKVKKVVTQSDENIQPRTSVIAPIAAEEVYEDILHAKTLSKVTVMSNAGTQCDDLPTAATQPKPSSKEIEVNHKENRSMPQTKCVTSTGTSPPPQTISTQTPIDMWPDSDSDEIPLSPSPPPPPPPSQSQQPSYLRKRIRGRKDNSHLRRAASLQMVNRDRRLSAGFSNKEEPEYDYGGWQQEPFRRTASRASLRDTSPSPPPSSTSGRTKRRQSYGRRTSAYEPKAGYSSREEERGDDEYDDDDEINWPASKPKKDYYLSMDNVSSRRQSKTIKNPQTEILQLVKEADKANFTSDDLQVAIYQCGNNNPVRWLKENWKTMVDTVVTLASRKDNAVGNVSTSEAKTALHSHKGNIWAAVTECVESRHRKIKELQRRSGMLSKDEVTAALTASAGDVEEALLQINKTSLKPFLMKIYGPPTGIENEAGAIRQFHTSENLSMLQNFEKAYKSQITSSSCESPEDSYGEEFYVVNDGELSAFSYEQMADSNPYARIDVESGKIQINDVEIQAKPQTAVEKNNAKQNKIISSKQLQQQNVINDANNAIKTVIENAINKDNNAIDTTSLNEESTNNLDYKQNVFNLNLPHENVTNYNASATEVTTNAIADKYEELIKEQTKLTTANSTPDIYNETVIESLKVSDIEPTRLEILNSTSNETQIFDCLTSIVDSTDELVPVPQAIPSSDNLSAPTTNSEIEAENEINMLHNLTRKLNSLSSELDSLFQVHSNDIDVANDASDIKNTEEIINETQPILANEILETEPVKVTNLNIDNEPKQQINTNNVQDALPQNTTPKIQPNVSETCQSQEIMSTNLALQLTENAIHLNHTIKDNELAITEPDNSKINSIDRKETETTTLSTDMATKCAVISAHNTATFIGKPRTNSLEDDEEENLCSNHSDEFYDANTEPIADASQSSNSQTDIKVENPNQTQSDSQNQTLPSAIEIKAESAISPSKISNSHDIIPLADNNKRIINKPSAVKVNVNKIKSKTKINPAATKTRCEMTPKFSRKKMEPVSKTTEKKQDTTPKSNERQSEFLPKTNDKPPNIDRNRKSSITNKRMAEKVLLPNANEKKPEDNIKPQVIVKTLFVRAATPSLIENKLETADELQAPETNQTSELDGSRNAAEHIHPETHYHNKSHYQIHHPVETKISEAAKPKSPVSDQVVDNDHPSTSKATALKPVESADELTSEEIEDSSAVPSSVSQTEDDEDDDDVEPMEPPLPVKADLGRRARQYLAEGKLPNYYKAEMAVKLLDLRFEESEAIFAATECSDLYMAVSYLQQDCELCAGKFPMGKMISMLNCVHRCCKSCAKDYFTLKIKERNIIETSCPFCSEPDLNNDDIATEYFNNLDIMLKNFVDSDVHELFQRKLRDRALMNEPNFRWCDKCGSGFIGEPNRRRIICPDCKTITCGNCNKLWERQHEGISCQQFEEWKKENDPEYQKQGLESYLSENGINCPKCKFKYDLAKGGCMHFTCSQCKYEFCSGCGKAFRMAGKCPVSPRCEKLGLHAHHPRNCLFYLRDKEPAELKKILEEHRIEYDESDDTDKPKTRCAVMEQREGPDGNFDTKCDRDVEAKQAGLCRNHFVEYLVSLICENSVDPVSIMDGAALEQEIRRHEKRVPERKPGELPEEYREVLLEVVLKEIPLEDNEIPYLARRPSKVSTYL